MTLSVDGFLARIGSMGRFQWILVTIVGIMLVPVTFQTLIMTFLGLEPPWRCAKNSTVCNFTRKCCQSLSTMTMGWCEFTATSLPRYTVIFKE